MKKRIYLFTMLLTISTFAIQPILDSCWDFADEELDTIVTDEDFGEPLTYEQEHDLWSSIYDYCSGGSWNYQG